MRDDLYEIHRLLYLYCEALDQGTSLRWPSCSATRAS